MVSTLILGASAVGVTAVGVGAVGYWYQQRDRTTVDDIIEESGDLVSFRRPEVSGGLLDLLKVWRHRSRAQKLAKRGYVKWYRIGSTVSRPQWVKPQQDGSGVPRYRVDSEPYYFPREAMVTDQETGAYVAMHYDGDADPINLRDNDLPALSTDKVERVINMEAESSAPGFFSNLDITPQKIMTALIGLIVVYALLMQFL